MRKLSIDEKISIKGKLATKGVLPKILALLDIKDALRLHWTCFGTPASMHSTPKMWRKRAPSSRNSVGPTYDAGAIAVAQ